MRLIWCVCAMLALTSASFKTHPHDEPEIFVLRGTLTEVDLVNRTIELDTFDPKTSASRNVLLFLDAKVKLRNGKARMDVAELKRGQRVTCTVELEHDEGRAERLTAFEIRVDTRA